MESETKRRLWVTIALLLVAIVGATNLVALARRMPPPPARSGRPADLVMAQELRFARVRGALQAHAVPRTLGYIADLPPEEMRGHHPSMAEYFTSQFAIVPWVIDANSEAHAWVLANLRTKTLPQRVPHGFHVVEDLRGGVWLLRKSAP